MKIKIKKEIVEKFMNEKGLTKNRFSKSCFIAVKSFDKFMREEPVILLIGLKIAGYMKVEYEELFDWE